MAVVSDSQLGMLLTTKKTLFEEERKEPGRIFKVKEHLRRYK